MGTELIEEMFRQAHRLEGNVELETIVSDEAGGLLAFSFSIDEEDYHRMSGDGLISDDFEIEATTAPLN